MPDSIGQALQPRVKVGVAGGQAVDQCGGA